MKIKQPYLFEASWEVCNKVGGIYTVLESKSEYIKAQYGDRYFLVGPYLGETTENDFIVKEKPVLLKKLEDDLVKLGIRLHYGNWLLNSEPQVILIDFKGVFNQINQIKSELWDQYRVDSLGSQFDFDEPIAWSWAVGKLIDLLKKNDLKKEQVIVQCHEWMAGTAILYLDKNNVDVATVFTTHATFLGRVLAFHNEDFYKELNEINVLEKIKEYNVAAKCSIEKAIALSATVLTTVSEVTAREAEVFYGRKPDVILPNGLDFNRFPNTEEITFKHGEFKKVIKEFIMYYFFPYYEFNLDKTLIYFLIGRNEVHAKGIDIFINSLAELNKKLKNLNSDKTIVAIISVPNATNGVRAELIQNRSIFLNIKQLLDSQTSNIYDKLLRASVGEFEIDNQHIFKKALRKELFAKLKFFKRSGIPPLSTHELTNEAGDDILNLLKQKGLTNKKEDKVKVISCPVYLNGADGLLNTNFYDFMAGAHFGVFPSFYEPWGYTPLEAGALGVSSVTSDLSGFGVAVNDLGGRKKFPGTYVLERTKFNYQKEVKDLAGLMYKYSSFNKDERLISRIHANQIARNFDWKILIRHYLDAHDMALKNIKIKVKV